MRSFLSKSMQKNFIVICEEMVKVKAWQPLNQYLACDYVILCYMWITLSTIEWETHLSDIISFLQSNIKLTRRYSMNQDRRIFLLFTVLSIAEASLYVTDLQMNRMIELTIRKPHCRLHLDRGTIQHVVLNMDPLKVRNFCINLRH